MRNRQIKIGAVLSYIQIIISIVVNLAYTPIMLKYLGKSEYGLYNTVASTISFLSILSLGFGSAYIRYYSKYKKNDDALSISRLNGLMTIIFSVIGFVGFICGLFLSFNLHIVFNNGLTVDEYITARSLMLILTINLTIHFPSIVLVQIITAHEKFIILKLLSVIQTVASPIVTIPLLMMGFKSIAVVCVTVGLSIGIYLIYIYYVFHVLKCKFIFHGFEHNLLREICSYTVFIAINSIIDQLNWNVDKVILGRYCGTIVVAEYSIGATLHNCFQHFSTSLNTLFTPQVHKLANQYQEGERETVFTEVFIRVGRIQFAILSLLATGFVFFGKSFITIWAGSEYSNSFYVALLLILPTYLPLIENMGIEIQRAQNKHKFRSFVYLAIAIINVITTILICPLWGAIGAAMCTAGTMIVGEWIIMNIYYNRCCEIRILDFFASIAQMAVGLIIPVTIGILLNNYIHIDNVRVLIVSIIAYTLIYCLSMYTLGFNNNEKQMMKKVIKRRMN